MKKVLPISSIRRSCISIDNDRHRTFHEYVFASFPFINSLKCSEYYTKNFYERNWKFHKFVSSADADNYNNDIKFINFRIMETIYTKMWITEDETFSPILSHYFIWYFTSENQCVTRYSYISDARLTINELYGRLSNAKRENTLTQTKVSGNSTTRMNVGKRQ